jgi:hypothetical protein
MEIVQSMEVKYQQSGGGKEERKRRRGENE